MCTLIQFKKKIKKMNRRSRGGGEEDDDYDVQVVTSYTECSAPS